MVAKDERDGNGQPVPSEPARKREAQDRAKGSSGQATSPVDAKHVESPAEQENERGHRTGKKRQQ